MEKVTLLVYPNSVIASAAKDALESSLLQFVKVGEYLMLLVQPILSVLLLLPIPPKKTRMSMVTLSIKVIT